MAVMTKHGEKNCYVILDGEQMPDKRNFTYHQAKHFCLSIGGRLPIINDTETQEDMLQGINKYKLDTVSLIYRMFPGFLLK